ncbi:hypothetical protein FACS18949_14470 [Clostridia bacterium]|nr:hypothetical protein FACS18949_14470 [Clostridia bacterium]
MITLKENERLVYAGKTALRAPDGTPLPAVPQYMIVPIGAPAAAHAVELADNERLILAGRVYHEKQTAEERFSALKARWEQPPREDGTPLYIKEGAENVNPKTGQTSKTEKAINALATDLLATFAVQMRKIKAAARCGIEEKSEKGGAW